MKPSDLYARDAEDTWKDLSVLMGCYYKHLPELEQVWDRLDLEKNEKVQIKVYRYVDYDGRRFWLLGGVYFDGQPVMIIRNAGREGDDHHSRFITDGGRYFEMLKYLSTLCRFQDKDQQPVIDLVAPDDDIPDLETFYGNSLNYSKDHHRYW